MNDQDAQNLLKAIEAQNSILIIMAEQIEKIAIALAPDEPSYRQPLEAYPDFDWTTINAKILDHDTQGATQVEWRGRIWRRHSGDGEYGKAVWFSRSIGERKYLRLITFKNYEKDPKPLKFQPGQPAQAPASAPMPQAQAVAAASTEGKTTRADFYSLVSQAMAKGPELHELVNEVIKSVNQEGWDWGVIQLQAQMA